MGGGDAGPPGACFTCHGLQGEGDGEIAPRLAGLPVGYLQKQLEDYAAGLRPDATMRSIARALDADERRRAAVYYAGLQPPATGASGSASAAATRVLYHQGSAARNLPACASCHGARGEGVGPANPPLAGQPPGYLKAQLAQWRRSERRNDPRGAMLAISQRLTTDEVEALARYAAAPWPGIAPTDAPPAAYP